MKMFVLEMANGIAITGFYILLLALLTLLAYAIWFFRGGYLDAQAGKLSYITTLRRMQHFPGLVFLRFFRRYDNDIKVPNLLVRIVYKPLNYAYQQGEKLGRII